ncbi:hypothetical protein Pmani_035151 [Petrolisthes manimaculis]|uniref:Uncharacterized protein n=1 Tax=Petrolisthes manimaculis TaxID=1843537 RepID=A0AAE1TQR6_9EUCA|nr:hypothetical protein Pmani_035151 [Petrolisthes manimaculis]
MLLQSSLCGTYHFLPPTLCHIFIHFQTASMKTLEQEGEEAAQRLQRGIERGDKLLDEINRALTDIANTQLSINRITEASQGDTIKI